MMSYFDGIANRLTFVFIHRFKARERKIHKRWLMFRNEKIDILNRLIQVLANDLTVEIRESLFSDPKNIISAELENRDIKLKSGAVINFSSGKYQLKLGHKLFREYLKFWFIWFVTFCSICKFFGDKFIYPGNKNAIIYGMSGIALTPHSGSRKLDEYIKKTPTSPLNGISQYILKVSKSLATSEVNGSNTSRFPEATLTSICLLSIWKRFILLGTQFSLLFKAHFLFITQPATLLFASDFGCLCVMRKLEEWKFYSVILITTSDTNAQPIWMRVKGPAELHYLHYSILPLFAIHKDDPFPEFAEKEVQFCYLADMKHWLWTPQDKWILEHRYGYKHGEVSGVPRFILENPSPLKKLPNKQTLHIVIFDVTPYQAHHVEANGTYYYYGTTRTARRLISDVLDNADIVANLYGLDLLVSLKQKRVPLGHHDPLYIEFLQRQLTHRSYFEVCDETSSIADVLSSDCLTISRPFTSAGLVAKQCGVDSIFYDPNNEIVNNCLEATGMQLINGPEKLGSVLKQHIESHKNSLSGRI